MGRLCGSPERCRMHLLGGMALSLRAPLRPLRPHPQVSVLSRTAREGSAFIWVVKPLTPPRPSSESSWGLELGLQVGGPGRARGAGNGSGAPRGRGPLGQALGPHWPPQGRACGTRGSRAPKRDASFSTTSAGPPLPSVRAASQVLREKPTQPPSHDRSQGSRPPGDMRPQDPYFKYDLWCCFHRLPPPPRTHNGLCVLRFSFGFRLPKVSPRISCAYEVHPIHTRPCILLSGASVAPPEPSGAHRQGRFLSFLFPTKSCCSKPRDKIKIARRTPK